MPLQHKGGLHLLLLSRSSPFVLYEASWPACGENCRLDARLRSRGCNQRFGFCVQLTPNLPRRLQVSMCYVVLRRLPRPFPVFALSWLPQFPLDSCSRGLFVCRRSFSAKVTPLHPWGDVRIPITTDIGPPFECIKPGHTEAGRAHSVLVCPLRLELVLSKTSSYFTRIRSTWKTWCLPSE